MLRPADIPARETNAAEDLSRPDAGLAVTGPPERNGAMRTALPSPSGYGATAVAAGDAERRLSQNLPVDNGIHNVDAKTNPVAPTPNDAAATPAAACVSTNKSLSSGAHAAAGDGNGREDRQAVVEERLQRLAQAAAGAFRQQREKLSVMRLFAAWRCAAARERSKRQALARLLQRSYKRRVSRGFWRWHAEARDIRAVVVRKAAEEEVAVAAAAVAVAANSAAETLASAREQELQRANAATAELQGTVKALQTEVRNAPEDIRRFSLSCAFCWNG